MFDKAFISVGVNWCFYYSVLSFLGGGEQVGWFFLNPQIYVIPRIPIGILGESVCRWFQCLVDSLRISEEIQRLTVSIKNHPLLGRWLYPHSV